MKRIFITGISGCLGHYLFEVLAKSSDYHLYLLLKDPERLRFDLANYPQVSVINGDLRYIARHSLLLKEMDYCLHLAAAWGSRETNYDYTLALFNLLDPERVRKVIYLSTASILGPDNQPLKEAGETGTLYIKAKYLCYKRLPDLKIYDRIVTLFPTWVLGGGGPYPYSHASSGIIELVKWLWIVRFFKADVRFHFIHARDIALIIDYLLRNDTAKREFVLGNPAVTMEGFIREVSEFFGKKVYFQINISPLFVKTIAFLLGKRLSPWDNFCLKKRHFEYDVVDTESFGINSNLKDLASILDLLYFS